MSLNFGNLVWNDLVGDDLWRLWSIFACVQFLLKRIVFQILKKERPNAYPNCLSKLFNRQKRALLTLHFQAAWLSLECILNSSTTTHSLALRIVHHLKGTKLLVGVGVVVGSAKVKVDLSRRYSSQF